MGSVPIFDKSLIGLEGPTWKPSQKQLGHFLLKEESMESE